MTNPARDHSSSYGDRPHKWVPPRKPIPCPQLLGGKEHTLHTNARLQSHGLIRCEHRPAAQQAQCGAWVWVAMFPSGWRYVAVVSQPEVVFMEHRCMSVDESLAYLGADVPPEAR